MRALPALAEDHYARPRDNLQIFLHYQMYRAPQGMHIAHCAIEWLLQFQVRSAFAYQEERQAVPAVRRSLNEVSCFPLIRFYFVSYQSIRLMYIISMLQTMISKFLNHKT